LESLRDQTMKLEQQKQDQMQDFKSQVGCHRD